MSENNEQTKELALIDLFALFLKKFLVIFICAVVGGVCGFTLAYFKNQKQEKNFESITENSFVTERSFSVIVRNMGLPGSLQTNSNTKQIDEILSEKIVSWWRVFNQSEKNNQSDRSEKIFSTEGIVNYDLVYLEEGMFAIYVVGKTPSESQNAVSNLYSSVLSFANNFADVNFQLISETTQKASENEFISSYLKHCASSSKYFVIGFLLMGFLSLIVLIFWLIIKNPVVSSSDFSKFLNLVLLGVFFSENSIFDKLSRRVLGEPKFKNDSEKLKWFESNYKTFVIKSSVGKTSVGDKEKTVVLSSADKPKSRLSQKILKNCIKDEIVFKAGSNYETNEKIKNADKVVLLEKQWVSRYKDVEYVTDIVKKLNKEISGFILY